MHIIKQVFFSGLLLFSCAAAISVSAADNFNAIIQAQEAFKTSDPLFSAWLKQQTFILTRLQQNISADQASNPEQAKSEQADMDYLQNRIAQEIEFFKNAPDLRAKGAYNIMDFGAKADGITDDGPALRQAISAAAKGEKRMVFLPKGKYLIGNPGIAERQAITLAGIPAFDGYKESKGKCNANLLLQQVSNLLIEGEDGTEIICPSPLDTAIMLTHCNNVRIGNLKISYASPAYTTGKIMALVGENQMDVAIDPGMIPPTDKYFKQSQTKGLIRIYASETEENSLRPRASSVAPHSAAPDVVHVKDNTYRFTIKDFIPVAKHYQPGLRVVFYARTYGNHAIINFCSDRTRFYNITLNSSSAMAFLNDGSDLMFITGCKVEAAPGSYISTCADGLYFRNISLGGYVADNTIRHIGDDFVNIHNILRPAWKQEGNVLYAPVGSWYGKILKVSRRIGCIMASRGETNVSQEAIITGIEIVKGDDQQPALFKITCNRALPPLVTRQSIGDNLKQLPDMLTLMENQTHGLVIANNTFEHGCSRFLVGGRNWRLTGNRFRDSLSHHMFFLIGAEALIGKDGGEGFQPRNITMDGNTFHSSAKTVFNFKCRINRFINAGEEKPSIATSHFFIENNTFDLYKTADHAPFVIDFVDGLIIRNNRINAQNNINAPVFQLNSGLNVTLENNTANGNFSALIQNSGKVENLVNRGNTLNGK